MAVTGSLLVAGPCGFLAGGTERTEREKEKKEKKGSVRGDLSPRSDATLNAVSCRPLLAFRLPSHSSAFLPFVWARTCLLDFVPNSPPPLARRGGNMQLRTRSRAVPCAATQRSRRIGSLIERVLASVLARVEHSTYVCTYSRTFIFNRRLPLPINCANTVLEKLPFRDIPNTVR